MKNSNLNNEYLDDEIDLRELLRTILNSKKLIIIVTLAFSLLAFIYTTQKELEYDSTVVLEVGSYDLLNGEKELIWPVSTLIKKLKINEISQQLNKLNFNSIEDHFLEINYTSPSPEFNENLINEAIRFTQESHAETLDKIVNSFSEKIMTIDSEVEFIKNSIKNQQESQKLNAINAIKAIDSEVEFIKNSIESQQESQKLKIEFLKNSIESQQESQKLNAIYLIKTIDAEIPALEAKIKFLLKLIPEEENNLLLLQSNADALLLRAASSPTLQQIIYSYNEQAITLKNKIQNLQQEKGTLEMQVKSIDEGKFASAELVKLSQEKGTLEMQVKSIEEGEYASAELFELQQEKDTLEMQVKSIEEGEYASAELFKLSQEKGTLEMQVKSIEEGEYASAELFELQQEKDTLELQIKLVKDQKSTTRPIRELGTSEVKPKHRLIILIGTIFGFIFSIFIVFIRQAFLKEEN